MGDLLGIPGAVGFCLCRRGAFAGPGAPPFAREAVAQAVAWLSVDGAGVGKRAVAGEEGAYGHTTLATPDLV